MTSHASAAELPPPTTADSTPVVAAQMPDRKVGLTAWALVVAALLVLFGVVPELVDPAPGELAAGDLAAAELGTDANVTHSDVQGLAADGAR